jgi:hypothetical protein
MFSFNSPGGRLPHLRWASGLKDFFDPARVVAYPTCRSAGGASRAGIREERRITSR